MEQAVQAAANAWKSWSTLPWESRAAVFLKAADLLSTRYRPILNAATLLGQSKTAFQAEIDSACELIDFFRFNPCFAARLMAEQPDSAPGVWNMVDYRALEGFVLAVTPFNFTSIAGNLPTAPALMGNTVLWKPASSAVYSAHFTMQLLEEAGLPPGVINFLPGPGSQIGDAAIRHPGAGGHPFHRQHRRFPSHVADRGRKSPALQKLSAAGRGNRRQGFHFRARLRRSGRAGLQHGARRV